MTVKVLDGGQSTQLEKYVCTGIDDNPLWISKYLLEAPNHVFQMHKDFLDAGADVISTLTYQATTEALMKYHHLSVDDSLQVFHDSVKIARDAWNQHLFESKSSDKMPLIAGSVGPYGAAQCDGSEYTGDYVGTVTIDTLKEWHRIKVSALVSAGVDYLAFETVPSVVEAEALLQLLREFPNQKAWLSFQCKDNKSTAHGENFTEAATNCWSMNPQQLVAVGCNCVDPHNVTNLLGTLKNMPLIVYPNSGEKYIVGKGWCGKAVSLSPLVPEWLNLGVRFIGGCCRTTSSDIASIRSAVDQFSL